MPVGASAESEWVVIVGSTASFRGLMIAPLQRTKVRLGSARCSVDAIPWLFFNVEGEEGIVFGDVLLGDRIMRPRIIDVGHVEFNEAVRPDRVGHANAAIRTRHVLRQHEHVLQEDKSLANVAVGYCDPDEAGSSL